MIPRHALTVQECEGATPPHQRRAANHVRGGLRVTCMLCGAVLESPPARSGQAVHAQKIPEIVGSRGNRLS
jgi:hypothetical protein